MATKKIGEIERHQYILNENAPAAMISLEKRIVKNDEWYEENAGKEVRKLEKYVRTKSNPEGWLDKRLYVPQNNKVVEETVKFFKKEDYELYSEYEIEQMTREKLILLSKERELNTGRVRTDNLKKRLLEWQKEYVSKLEQKEKEEKENEPSLDEKLEKLEILDSEG